MIRYAVVAGLLAALVSGTPSFALTPNQKMATCKFGANDQKLTGAARAKFIKNCMANKNDPRGVAVPAGTGGPAAAPPPKN
jgi:hypothetical protein